MEQDLASGENNEQQQAANDVITVVVTANNRLGYSALNQQRRKNKELQQRLRRAFQQATDFAIGQGVDLFIQAGDLFDTAAPSEQDRSFVAARLAQLRQAGIRAFAIGGAHDTPPDDAAQNILAPQESYARLGALHYFPPQTDDLEPVMVDLHGVRLGFCGIGASTERQGDPLASVRVSDEIERAALSLLIVYASIEGLSPRTPYFYTRAQIRRASIENQSTFRVILSGFDQHYSHIRTRQCDVIAAGATQHIAASDFAAFRKNTQNGASTEDSQSDPGGELQDSAPGFVFMGLAADGVRWCRHIPVDALSLRQIAIQTSELFSTDHDAIAPTEYIIERLLPLCDDEALVQLRLEGSLTREHYHQLNFTRIRRSGEERCFALTIDDSALVLLPDGVAGSEGERLSAREELIALADEWIASAPDEQEKNALRATKEELLAAIDSR